MHSNSFTPILISGAARSLRNFGYVLWAGVRPPRTPLGRSNIRLKADRPIMDVNIARIPAQNVDGTPLLVRLANAHPQEHVPAVDLLPHELCPLGRGALTHGFYSGRGTAADGDGSPDRR